MTKLFTNQVYLLTGKSVNLNTTNPNIIISQKYYSLFNNCKKKLNLPLNKVANLVDSILLRREEFGNGNLDKYSRFDHDKSILVNNRLDQSPIVDELILDVIKQLGLKIRNIWPKCKKAAVCLTHDVDALDGLSYFWLRKANWYWNWMRYKVNRDRQNAEKWITKVRQWNWFKDQGFDPMDSFDQIREVESSYGFRSTFYFMSLRHGFSREGRMYAVKNPRFIQVARELFKDGWEVGLHAAYHNHLSLTSLIRQRQRLEEVIQTNVTGCRHHYLRVRFPRSWVLYAQAGFNYASNMGWGSGFNGFRAGTCLPYRPLNEESFWEIPFQLMDTNPILREEDYLNRFSKYLSRTKAVGGCLVINFHQENLSEETGLMIREVYRNILEMLAKDQEVIVLTMDELWRIMKQIVKLS